MTQLLRLLIGYRDDLDLSARWWHRLAQVSWALVALGIFLFGTLASHESEMVMPKAHNVRIVARLHEFVLENKEAKQLPAKFAELNGKPGIVRGERILRIYPTWEGECRTLAIVAIDGKPVTDKEELAFCDGFDPSAMRDVIRYQPSLAGTIRVWVRSGLVGLAWTTGLSMLVMNVYFRGLVYVICGPRRKNRETAPA